MYLNVLIDIFNSIAVSLNKTIENVVNRHVLQETRATSVIMPPNDISVQ